MQQSCTAWLAGSTFSARHSLCHIRFSFGSQSVVAFHSSSHVVSHTLCRTPFHGVMSSLQLLIEDEKMSRNDRQEVLNGALTCGEGLLSTLDDILSIAKTKYTSSVGLEPYCNTTLLHDVEAILKPFAMRRDVVFSQHQMLLSAARGDTEVNSTSLSQVKGDITIIKQVSCILCPPAVHRAVHLQPVLESVNVKHRTHAHQVSSTLLLTVPRCCRI